MKRQTFTRRLLQKLFSLVLLTGILSGAFSATLIDDKGEIVGKNLSGTPEAEGIFRTITVRKPFQKGGWKLKLQSRYLLIISQKILPKNKVELFRSDTYSKNGHERKSTTFI